MKCKQKPTKHCESVYYEQSTVAKGRSQHNNEQSYNNNNSHFPISGTTQSVIHPNSHHLQYLNDHNLIYSSHMKSHPNVSKTSPYMQLHTLQSGTKLIGTTTSNNISYSSQMQARENHYPYKQRSIYDQMADSRSFGVQLDQNYRRNNLPTTQRQLHNHDYISNQQVISTLPLSCNNKGFSKGQMRREIDGKLERVCEKVGLLSVEKRSCGDHSPINANNNFKKQLCYSTIVYQPTPQTLPQSHISSNPTNNLIQVYQMKIIQLQKRASQQHGKIQKLEQQLLKERQLLIKKEKDWLLRENQLLSWIQENEREIQEIRAAWMGAENIRLQQQDNVVVIDDNHNLLIDQQQHLSVPPQQHHNNISTHRNYHCTNNPPNIKPNSTSKYSSHHRRFSNNHSTISQAQTSNNNTRQNNLLSTHKKSTYGKRQSNNRKDSVGDKVQDKVRRCLMKQQNNEMVECYCDNQVFHPMGRQTLKESDNRQTSLLQESDYELYQLITLQAKSIQSLMSHLSPTEKTIPSSFEQKQEQNLLFSSYPNRQQETLFIANEIC